MSKAEATATVFWTAFKGLSRSEQQAVVVRLVRDDRMRRDLLDLAVIESRRREPSRSLRSYLKRRDR